MASGLDEKSSQQVMATSAPHPTTSNQDASFSSSSEAAQAPPSSSSSAACTRHRRTSTATEVLFGMHVVPVSTFLDLNLAEYGGQIPAHQVLKEKGLLVVYDPLVHEGEVAFISHQWTAWNAADPGFDQLGVLKRFIERILEGDIKKVAPDWIAEILFKGVKGMEKITHAALLDWVRNGYIWFDYWSVPQTVGYDVDATDELMAAVESIPAYVEWSWLFIVLTPPAEHKDTQAVVDFSTWLRRGWCRAEAMARLLARDSGPMIKLQSAEGTPELIPSHEAWAMQPGKGQFTCCWKNHLFPQEDKETGEKKMVQVPCDKIKVGALVHTLVDTYESTKKAALAEATNEKESAALLLDLRWMLSMRHHMLVGLETAEELAAAKAEQKRPAAEVLAEFLEEYHFPPLATKTNAVNGSRADRRSGLTPLFYAVVADNVAVARELLRLGADVESPLLKGDPTRSLFKGMTLLITAAFLSSGEMVTLLLDNGANAMAKEKQNGFCASHLACGAGNHPALCVLLDREPQLMEARENFGNTPLLIAVQGDPSEGSAYAMELLRRGAAADERTVNGFGCNALMIAAVSKVADGTIVLDALLKEGKIGVDTGSQWNDFNTLGKTLMYFGRVAHGFNRFCCCGRRESSAMVKFLAGYAKSGGTPLNLAARTGNVAAVRSLLAVGANPFLQDSLGRTARDYATLQVDGGPHPFAIALLKEAEEKWIGPRPTMTTGRGGGGAKVSSEL